MLYKRPNFKMGGSPTGIETLEPRKKFQFGTPGFSFVEPGLQRELQIQNELKNKPKPRTYSTRIGPTRTPFQAKFPLLSSSTSAMGVPSISTAATLAAPFAPVGVMAYLNRPRTDEALKFMKSAPSGTFDETNLDVGEFYKELSEKNKQGNQISFLDAFL